MRLQIKYPPAGFWIRGAASILDGIILAILVWIVSSGALAVTHVPERSIEKFDQQDVIFLIFLVLSGFYCVMSWRKWQATPAKRLLGIQVVSATDGSVLSLAQALVRWMTYSVSFGLFGVGFLMVAFHPRKWALHDVLSRSQVVRKF